MDNIFYYLSKITWLIIALDSLMLIWLALGVFCLIKKYFHLSSFLLISLLCVNVFIAIFPVGEWLLYSLERHYSPVNLDPASYDGVIILGGGQHNGPTQAWQQVALSDAGERSLTLLVMAQKLPQQVMVVFTGGNGAMSSQGMSDASVVQKLLRENNIPDDRIIYENQSRNTFENAVLSKLKVLPKPSQRWLLVTSAFHMPRAMDVFCKINWAVDAYPVDFRSRKNKLLRLDWNYATHLNNLNLAYREWIGIFAYRISNKSC